MKAPELFGLIVTVLMIANIGLFLHNRHLAAMVRELSAIVERMKKSQSPEAEDPETPPEPKRKSPFAWLLADDRSDTRRH